MKRLDATEPQQGEARGARVQVIFGYDVTRRYEGKIVRDDAETPRLVIIRLDNGQHVLGTECQYKVEPRPASGGMSQPEGNEWPEGSTLVAMIDAFERLAPKPLSVMTQTERDEWQALPYGLRAMTPAPLCVPELESTPTPDLTELSAVVAFLRSICRAALVLHELDCQAEDDPPCGQDHVDVYTSSGCEPFTRLADELSRARAAADEVLGAPDPLGWRISEHPTRSGAPL